MDKTWKVVSGYDRYEVSSDGNVRRISTGRILKKHPDLDGYYRVGLYQNRKQKSFKISRLVALNFIPNPENKREVNHKNGDKGNDCVENLEWVTPEENIQHAYTTGLMRGPRRGETRSTKLSTEQVLQIKVKYDSGRSQRSLAKEYGVSQGGISAAIRSIFPNEISTPGNGAIQKELYKIRPSLVGQFTIGAPKITREQAEQMKAKYDQGYSQSEIAKEFGITQNGVSGAIRSLSGRRRLRRTSADALPTDAVIERGNGTLQRARHALRKALLESLHTKSA